ncbi:putative phospholipid ABC transporter-binding protein MlaD [Lacunisphaera limnophila]|jgi:phospholipid/cholesterol/gamma-HCH transport system substrate-binding protein|uniref:Putative phospholipid ABC transporter-binding protein MlaD n=1 Tax=Lacunisphaera limnophila TaxID=1838286 RepID=A0A1D8ASE0_9BACT|nr:MlaD family protein [Lacunisphaera limnophila]AOS43780.1 putative phospholipid ABC transporter-binding protein MlaD [Lacunisphaera limnophila]
MNNTSQTIRVGLFFLLGLALAWITFESLNGGRLFKQEGYSLVAGFANLKGLKTGDEIRMAGVKVGAVKLTRLAGNRVEAVLSIEPGVNIPTDAVASVEQSSLLGSNYLGVTFGTPGSPLLKDGDEIQTKATVDMSEVISQLGNLGSKLEQVIGEIGKSMGTGGENGSIFERVDKLVTENGPKLTETIANLQDITAKIKGGEGTFGKLVNDSKLHDELLAGVSEIKLAAADARTFMGDAKNIVADVKTGKGALGVLLYDEPTAASLKVSVNNLKEVSEKLNSGQGTLGKLISDDSLYLSVQSTMKKADRMIDGLGDQGPITAVGVAAQSLF